MGPRPTAKTTTAKLDANDLLQQVINEARDSRDTGDTTADAVLRHLLLNYILRTETRQLVASALATLGGRTGGMWPMGIATVGQVLHNLGVMVSPADVTDYRTACALCTVFSEPVRAKYATEEARNKLFRTVMPPDVLNMLAAKVEREFDDGKKTTSIQLRFGPKGFKAMGTILRALFAVNNDFRRLVAVSAVLRDFQNYLDSTPREVEDQIEAARRAVVHGRIEAASAEVQNDAVDNAEPVA